MAGKFDPNNAQNLMEVRQLSLLYFAIDSVSFLESNRASRNSELCSPERIVSFLSYIYPACSFTPFRFAPSSSSLSSRTCRFAVKAVEQAQTYWNLLEKVNPKDLKLTKYDDEIFDHLMATFPELNQEPYEKLVKIDEDWMKSKDGKNRWRTFIESYKDKVKDYNFGSLIRTDARDEYGESNTIFVTRIQFYAYEIARNRLGLNEKAHQIAIEDAAKEKAKKEKEAKAAAKKKGGKS
uniref:Polysaccharide biosynthesis domain-containing protein n=1 Tax=Psilocybe cubensis TaxID=181762 RepID=A0A8H7XRE2_PSICU